MNTSACAKPQLATGNETGFSFLASSFGSRLHDTLFKRPEIGKTDPVQVLDLGSTLFSLCWNFKIRLETQRMLQTKTRINDILFLRRLDLVPINRSVGLKAKPTKPVTEVLRPVVAKYGLHLSGLVARIVRPAQLQTDTSGGGAGRGCHLLTAPYLCVSVQSGESEPLDLGLPISNLDGLRVVLDVAENAVGKGEAAQLVSSFPLVQTKGERSNSWRNGWKTGMTNDGWNQSVEILMKSTSVFLLHSFLLHTQCHLCC